MKRISNSSIILGLFLIMASCVQEEHLKTVPFKVNMSQLENVNNVGIRGQFTSPPWEVTVPMKDENNDGIYEVTLSEMTAQSSVDFKFVNQNDQFELECKPNRSLNFEYRPETLEYSALYNNETGNQIKLK